MGMILRMQLKGFMQSNEAPLLYFQALESVWWTEDGGCILSSHTDGSYCRWTVGETDGNEEKSDTPYGEEEEEPQHLHVLVFP